MSVAVEKKRILTAIPKRNRIIYITEYDRKLFQAAVYPSGGNS